MAVKVPGPAPSRGGAYVMQPRKGVQPDPDEAARIEADKAAAARSAGAPASVPASASAPTEGDGAGKAPAKSPAVSRDKSPA